MQKNNFRNTHITHAPKAKLFKNENNTFSQKQIVFEDTPLFFPAGLEKLFLLIYFIILPYLAGIIFLFFYIGEGDFQLFLSLNKNSSFILTWIIGYEILASLILLYIVKLAISFSLNNIRGDARKNFKRP